jgi:mRNA interferase MazF
MSDDSAIQPGDIVLIPFPFTDLKSQKVRPALVISKAEVHQATRDHTLMFISSNLPSQLESFELVLKPEDPEFKVTGLKVSSVFKGNKLVTLHRNLIQRRLGFIPSGLKPKIDAILQASIGFSALPSTT